MRHTRNILTPEMLGPIARTDSPIYAVRDLVIFHRITTTVATPLLKIVQLPQYVHMGRFVCIREGSAQFNINLIPHRLTKGDILIISPDTYIEIPEVSEDICLDAISFPSEDNALGKTVLLKPNDKDFQRIIGYVAAIWELVHRSAHSEKAVTALRSAIAEELLFLSEEILAESGVKLSRPDDLFHRFQELLCKGEVLPYSVDAYAERLFVTPNYLSAVVKAKSGRTVMQCINSRIILEAKVMLLHSNAPVYEIADSLGFSSSTFFCRFFRRETGLSPLQYRNQ